MSTPDPAFDWPAIARLAITSRAMDELEEERLYPQGHVVYQFSARGHELGQLLISQLLDRPGDAASVYYRSRPFMLGSGVTVTEAFASGMARAAGLSGGRDVGVTFNLPRRSGALVLPMAGDVGSQYTPAAGWAQALRYRVTVLGEEALADSIAVAFGGDGSVAANGFWSALTLATTLALPLLFFIEDNGYAISVTGPAQTPGGNIAANLASFGDLRIWEGSGTDPADAAARIQEAVTYVRAGHGPGLLRLTMPRLSGHSSHDNQAYKDADTRAQEEARDPLPALRRYLVPALYSAAEWEKLVADVQAEVAEAAEAALALPAPNPATATRYVFSEPGERQQAGGLAADRALRHRPVPRPRPPWNRGAST